MSDQDALITETGKRAFSGLQKKMFFGICALWSLFQLWYASPLPFIFDFLKLNDTEARSIHLAFAIFLVFMAFPFLEKKQTKKVPWHDWILAVAASLTALYIYIYYAELADRSGAPILLDIVIGVVGLVLLLEATRRALGPALVVVALVFLLYSLFGPYMPDVISHKGASITKLVSHQWLTTEGVFGVALGVSTSFVFLFVLFGAFLEQAGAGLYFIQVAFSLMGHMRGGPAKAAVVASGLSGIISGSSIANVVTTGNFTIPLMKKVGFPDYKAGAIEVAASTNGQLMPPIMGAAAFLMVEYVGIPYIEVIKHAVLPAVISYIALVYIVHLEAVKAGMKGIKKTRRISILQKMANSALFVALLGILTFIVYFGVGQLKVLFPDGGAVWFVMIGLLISYYILLRVAAKQPDLKDIHFDDVQHIPDLKPTLLSGLYFLLPLVVLLWFMTVERYSPGLSVFYALILMIFIMLTHRPILAYLRKKQEEKLSLKEASINGGVDLWLGLVNGAKNMIGIGVATATAGIVVGTVTLTGIGQVMIEVVELVSGGNLILMLMLTAVISIILGMGLPTTANYIVVATLMAPVIVGLGAQGGLVVPLIAVHMFVFYFGILADDTPPVGLAAFAAAAISKGDPIKTGIQGFTYDIRTAILPFMFIYNTELLLIGIDSVFALLITIISAVMAMLVFSAATQGFWIVRSKYWETALLLVCAFTFFRPDFWLNQISPEYEIHEPGSIYELVDERKIDDLRIVVEGYSLDGDLVKKTVILNLPAGTTAEERIKNVGLDLTVDTEAVAVSLVEFDSAAAKAGIDFGWSILSIEVKANRITKTIFYIPAILLLFLVYYNQKRRREKEGEG